jgi:16S rRNA G966 N2-methylase RsmD
MTKRRKLPGLRKDEGYTVHPFDETYGVRTSGLIAGRHLGAGHAHDKQITAYFGVAPSVFRRLIAKWRREGARADFKNQLSEYTFVDVGAGMGRGMLLAAEIGFREVWGVELNPVLAGIALKNLRRWKVDGRLLDGQRMKLIEGDATEMKLPAGPVLLFLFNPFEARLMKKFLEAVEAQREGNDAPVELLYVNHEQDVTIERRKVWTRFFKGDVARTKADAIADHKIMAAQPDGEYTSANHEECSGWKYRDPGLGTSRLRR